LPGSLAAPVAHPLRRAAQNPFADPGQIVGDCGLYMKEEYLLLLQWRNILIEAFDLK
jgi:hypothetical protein